MDTRAAANYLADLGTLLKERALEARANAGSEKGNQEHQFELGRLTAYYEVLSLMRQQANAFGLDLRDVSLHDFDPDAELLRDA